VGRAGRQRSRFEQDGFLFSPQWGVKHVGLLVFGVESLLANPGKSSSKDFFDMLSFALYIDV